MNTESDTPELSDAHRDIGYGYPDVMPKPEDALRFTRPLASIALDGDIDPEDRATLNAQLAAVADQGEVPVKSEKKLSFDSKGFIIMNQIKPGDFIPGWGPVRRHGDGEQNKLRAAIRYASLTNRIREANRKDMPDVVKSLRQERRSFLGWAIEEGVNTYMSKTAENK